MLRDACFELLQAFSFAKHYRAFMMRLRFFLGTDEQFSAPGTGLVLLHTVGELHTSGAVPAGSFEGSSLEGSYLIPKQRLRRFII